MDIRRRDGRGNPLCGGALGPLAPRRRAAVALAGIVIDWIPVITGWMTVEGVPPRLLLAAHLGFGGIGYLLLICCLVAWVQASEGPQTVRLWFVGIWGISYLAGVTMIALALAW